AHDLTQQNERWICELVFFQDRIERNIFTVMPKLAIGHVEYDSVCDLFPVCVARQEDKLRVSVDEFFDEPWARDSVHFNFLAGDPFHRLDFSCGSLVLVCGRCCCALRRAPNLYPARCRAHRRRTGRFCCRSECCIVDSSVSLVSLAQQTLDSKI